MLLETLTRRIEPDIVVLELTGKLVRGPEARAVEELVLDLLQQDQKSIVLDLTHITYLDSTGIGIPAYGFFSVKHAGGRFHVVAPAGKACAQFLIARLDTVIPVYSTVAAACQGFKVPPGQ